MCGIVGIANSGMGKVDRDTVMTIKKAYLTERTRLSKRYYPGDGVGLGMRSLAIIDIKAGRNRSTMKIRPYGLSLTEKSTITGSYVELNNVVMP